MAVGFVDMIWDANQNSFRPNIDPEVPEWHSIDFRADATIADGRVLVSCDVSAFPDGALLVTDDPLDLSRWTWRLKRDVGNELGVTLLSDNLKSALLELFIEHGNDENPNRWNSLKPTADGQYEIWLRDRVVSMPTVSGGSVITENFNTANSTTLGPNLSWTEYGTGNLQIVSNVVNVTNLLQDGFARADTDLESDDNYAQIEFTSLTNVTHGVGAALCRYSSSANTAYEAGRTLQNTNTFYLNKVVAGTRTQLATTAFTYVLGTIYTFRVNASGSTIWATRSGGSELSVTDSSITSGKRGGFMLNANVGTARARGDNFEAGDLGFFGYPKIIYYMNSS